MHSPPIESAQVKQLEDFEARKGKENGKIEEEMRRSGPTMPNGSRQIWTRSQRRKTRWNWQMAMQHETQRMAEVIELCGKRPEPAAKAKAMAAATGPQGGKKTESASATTGSSSPVRPTLNGH
jgi:hypothetical protein